MRYIIIFIIATLPLIAYPQVHIVDNNTNAPGGANRYTSLSAAIDSAAAGDTIYIVPSSTSYGDLTLKKQLTIIGGGYFPEGGNKKTSQVNFVYIDGTIVSGSTISSLYIWDEVYINSADANGNITGLTISNNYIDERIYSYSNSDSIDLSIKGNIIGDNSGTPSPIEILNVVKGISVEGNIIMGYTTTSYGSVNIPSISGLAYFTNNIFLGSGSSYSFENLSGATVDYNIFYGRSPETYDTIATTFSGNTFSNNISFSTLNDFGDTTNFMFNVRNTDGGNNITVDPNFINLALTDTWGMHYDVHPQDTTATNTTPDIGVYLNMNGEEYFSADGSILPAVQFITGASEIVAGSNLTLDLTLHGYGNFDFKDEISAVEYFIDVQDPGVGLATDAGVVGPLTSPAAASVVLTTSALTEGLHHIYIRAKNSTGIWGNYEQYLINVTSTSSQTTPSITAMEYFFDTDPGYGLGTALSVTADTSVTVTDSIATSGLSPGFHTLFLRAMDSNGDWGIPESRLIYVNDSSVDSVGFISNLEYFFDEDPGYGQGTAINVTTPASTIEVLGNIPTDSLAAGFHTLFIRAQDSYSRWGIPESRLIYVDDVSVDSIASITALEYFFDSDPGYGMGKELSVSTPAKVVDVVSSIPTDSLSVGFHTLFIRAKNADGNWGIPESRLIYVDDNSVDSVANITSLEYFFDTDPGYGQGTAITVTTPSSMVEVIESISTASLSAGFHTFFIRAQNADGVWGIPESRLVYIDDNAINVISPITAIEYFLDTDPGYGSGTQIPIASPDDSIKLAWNVSSLSLGTHVLGIRAKNAEGIWSITETFKFRIYSEGRELDSAALVEIYEKNGGTGWATKTNWITTNSIDTWFGVTLDPATSRVTSLDLNNNNLTGDLAVEFGYLLDLVDADISSNQLTDTVPNSVGNLINLQSLDISDNQFNGLPNLSLISTLTTLNLDSNAFEFGDLESQIGISNLTYSNQSQIMQGYDSIIQMGQAITLSVSTSGTANSYQWYKDSTQIPGATASSLPITTVEPYHAGIYHVEVASSKVPELIISSNNFRLKFDAHTIDSLALVNIYDSMGGTGWTNQTNWLSGNLNTWYGITVRNGRVTKIDLSNNNLIGDIPKKLLPDSIFTAVDTLILANNNITGPLPKIYDLQSLVYLDVSGNRIETIPNNIKTNIPSINTLKVENNRLQFGPIENNLAITNFTYAPQDSVAVPAEVKAVIGGKATFKSDVSGANNMYQWYKDGAAITGANLDTLTISNIDFVDEGLYQARITNSLITSLTLYTTNARLVVQGLEADSLALVEFYNTNGGETWLDNTNWLTGGIATWFGVTVTNERVSQVDMPGNNVTGSLAASIANLTALERLDLSGNSLTALPDLSGLSVLAYLDVSNNQLQFSSLEKNVGFAETIYSPQDSIGTRLIDTIAVHENYTFYANATGSANNYQWYYKGTVLSGATMDSLVVTDVTRANMGDYYVEVTNNIATALTLTSHIKTVLASATISGVVDDDNAALISEGGEMILLRITASEGYDTIFTEQKGNQVFIQADGSYTMDNVVLDDYMIAAVADTIPYPDHLPTYYSKAIFWEEADTLNLFDHVQNLNMTITIYQEGSLGGDGIIHGYVEEETGTGGKVLARKRVRGAGVSVRRGRKTGRKLIEKSRILEDTELVGYSKSNKDGSFSFTELTDDVYYLNIQYPGYPMDSTSFIEIPIGNVSGGRTKSHLKEVEVEALVDKGKISVRQINVVSVYMNELYDQIRVYPNPADNFMNVDLSKYGQSFNLYLFDSNGKVVESHKNVSGEIKIDVRDLSKGVYILRVLDIKDAPAATLKVVIN